MRCWGIKTLGGHNEHEYKQTKTIPQKFVVYLLKLCSIFFF